MLSAKTTLTAPETKLFSDHNLVIYFNSKNNVAQVILALTYYEFKSNIHSIFWDGTGDQDTFLKIWVEGVMYHEARRPE
jgi:hypothetical protein